MAAKTSSQLTLAGFDYGEIPSTVVRSLEADANAIDRAKGKALAAVIEMGERLAGAHDKLANHGNGTFGKWVEQRCHIARRTAERYINVHQWIGPVCDTVSQTLDISAAYLLSSDNCPESATKEALKLAEKGEQITKARAKEIIAKYTVDDESTGPMPDVEDDDSDDLFDWMSAEDALHEAIEEVLTAWPHDDKNKCLTVARTALQNALNQLEGYF